MTMKRLQVETVAQAYLDLLEDRGVTFFLANGGSSTGRTWLPFSRSP